ncbi:MAG TPA: phosphotransferase [Streptosporangiaceae bacterium]
MLTPPDGLPGETLPPMLERWWGVAAAAVKYLAVGWGSHHWEVTDTAGQRWFVTADELEHKRLSAREPLTAGFARLRAALTAARDLRDCGREFVVAPVPAADGEPVVRVADGGFGLAVYPFIDGQRFEFEQFSAPEDRLAVLGLLAAVHTAPAAARRHAVRDDYAVPRRDDLEAACAGRDAADRGPYARPAAVLLKQHAAPVRRLLDRYDGLAGQARSGAAAVLTHGEPHPGNTMLTAGGWRLIDWDTALVAPPERDLWSLDPGDGSILDAYASATGVRPQPHLLDLYRLRWDLTDLALEVSRFRRPHAGSSDDEEGWALLRSLIEHISG